MEPRWYVLSPQDGLRSCISESEAREHAERLAKDCHGCVFTVFKSVADVQWQDKPCVWREHKEQP